MNILLYVVVFIVVLLACFFLYRIVVFQFEKKRHSKAQYSRVRNLDNKLEKKEVVDKDELIKLASSNISRVYTYEVLNRHKKAELFPKEYLSFEMAAEGYLVNWLEFPTELKKVPDSIEYIEQASFKIEEDYVNYYIFRFKTNEPHWAAKKGWMLGVVGPYLADSKPYDFPVATFSRLLTSFDAVSPYEEAKWVHKNITYRRKGLLKGILPVEKFDV